MASGSKEIPSSDRHARKTGRRAKIAWIGLTREREKEEKDEKSVIVVCPFFWLREESEPTRAATDEKSEDELEDGRVEVASRWEGR